MRSNVPESAAEDGSWYAKICGSHFQPRETSQQLADAATTSWLCSHEWQPWVMAHDSMVLPDAPKRAFGRTRQDRASPEMLPGFNVVKEAAEWIRCPLCTGCWPCASPLHDTQKQTWLIVAQAQSHTPASASSGSRTWARGDGDPDKTRMRRDVAKL